MLFFVFVFALGMFLLISGIRKYKFVKDVLTAAATGGTVTVNGLDEEE